MNDHTSDTLTFGGAGSMLLVGMAEPSLAMGVLGGAATVLGIGLKLYELYLKHHDFAGRIAKLEKLLAQRDDWIRASVKRHQEPDPGLEPSDA